MAKAAAVTMENFINNWNAEFPEYQLTVEDLKKSHSVMGALFQIFDRLGIDRDAVLMPPPEKTLNEHMTYYWDLIPVINMTRVINHLVSVMPQVATISVNHFLQPTALTSHSILLLLFNLMVFNEQRLQGIAPYEEELFNFSDMIKALEEKKTNLFEMLNRQAEEKGKRAERMEQMNQEILQLEEELKQEEQARDQEKQELDPIIKENNMTEVLLDQKKATKEGLLADRERKKALRVYDAEDIRTQAAQAAQNVQEAEEKLNSLKSIIAQKENSLQILQMIKPNLDTANNLLHEIAKLKDYEMGDLDEDSKDGELDLLNTDLMELQAHQAELSARRLEQNNKMMEGQARRQHERTMAESALREAEDKDKKRREFTVKATQRTQEIKQQTTLYDEEKTKGIETIQQIKEDFVLSVKEWEDALVKMVADARTDIVKKLSVLEE
ncbi:trichohyalin-like [Pectinophora gossypiella]|uniref:trichohyalin-like n=1 Tax=Pectinophora gossypiella TaxID=13191 RepID=UPI00214F5212|nr:trichohyalin-like [Pectinophora gossypiella]XP_049868389.1 trichohyalin-like [Pectinophora gossypiella]